MHQRGAQGINLQTRCRDLIHFDLPWNPSRLEQRKGRIEFDLRLVALPELIRLRRRSARN